MPRNNSSSSSFQLARSKAEVLSGPTPPKAGATWVTDLSFEQIHAGISKSFHGDPEQDIDGEPVFDWIFNQCPNSKLKAEALPMVVTFPLKESMAQAYLDLSIRKDDGVIASTAVLVEYKSKAGFGAWWERLQHQWIEVSIVVSLARIRNLPKLFIEKEWRHVSKDIQTKCALLSRRMPTWHKQHGPKGRHLYVNFVASNPDCQGQGYGSILMRKIGELADAQRVDCYLECGNLKNKVFYEKFGFEVVASPHLEDSPTASQVLYLMVRRHR